MLALLTIIFGDPRAVLFARTLAALSILCPCAPDDAACPGRHQTAAAAIVIAANDAEDPERAAVLLLAAGAHETRFRVLVQKLDDGSDGPARSWFQVEPRGATRAERAEDAHRLETDPLYAARAALPIAQRGWGTYACGDAKRCPDAAAGLRRYEAAARWALR